METRGRSIFARVCVQIDFHQYGNQKGGPHTRDKKRLDKRRGCRNKEKREGMLTNYCHLHSHHDISGTRATYQLIVAERVRAPQRP